MNISEAKWKFQKWLCTILEKLKLEFTSHYFHLEDFYKYFKIEPFYLRQIYIHIASLGWREISETSSPKRNIRKCLQFCGPSSTVLYVIPARSSSNQLFIL